MHQHGELHNDLVVATVMSNLGFRRALEERGIEVVLAPVGDKHVQQAMTESGAVIGGEQSGHVIFGQLATTGDGVLTALQIARAKADSDKPILRVGRLLRDVPAGADQRAHARQRTNSTKPKPCGTRSTLAEADLGEDGRVLVRASGTEPIVRVMVEAADRATAERVAGSLAESVQKHLG